MTFFFWLFALFILYLAVEQERHELWVVRVRLFWRRLSGRGDGPSEWS